MSNYNNNPIQTKTNSNATASPSQTLYLPHTAPNFSLFEKLRSSSSVPNERPINASTLITQNRNLLFAGTNKAVKSFDAPDYQFTPEAFRSN